MSQYYIGLSVTFHDPAIAIINDQGGVLFAEATERPLQNKRALNCAPDQLVVVPGLLAQHCPDLREVVIAINWNKKRPWYENVVATLGVLTAPGLLKTGIKKLRSPLENYQLHHMMACQRTSIVTAGINLVRIIREHYPDCVIRFKDYDHHLTHAAAACYSSPFAEASCAVIDSYGENGAMAFYRYQNRKLERLYEAKGLSLGSLGFYYMKITELCGFDWLKGEEWKVMGLAAYGKLDQDFYAALNATLSIEGLACKHPSQQLFQKLAKLNDFKKPATATIEQKADLAFTGQAFFADTLTALLGNLHSANPSDSLTMAGGCALNSSFNGQITRRTPFKQVHIPSAPADDGCALGAAWLAFHAEQPQYAEPPKLQTPYTGSEISQDALERLLKFNRTLSIQHHPEQICERTAELLAQGKLVAWVQGKAEFGPRALGNRSILADPRNAKTQDEINQKIKFREQFRPFAPSILHEHGATYFEDYHESPYMDKTLVIKASKRNEIAAVCHIDGTGRLQTVKQEWNPRFHQLISCFYQLTEIPMLLNTSFNVMGKPLVHSLEDAIAVFLTTGLGVLVINDYLIIKSRDE
ncbi:MAG: nodulation protein nolNO [Methylococcaceae bacterium]|nr:nodulation protein nolNO [Methylococcaceae bacterium]